MILRKPRYKTMLNGQEVEIEQSFDSGQFYMRTPAGNIPIEYGELRDIPFQMKLRYWRCRYGYSQKEMALMLNVANSQVVSNWEQGFRKPNTDNFDRMNHILGGHLDD